MTRASDNDGYNGTTPCYEGSLRKPIDAQSDPESVYFSIADSIMDAYDEVFQTLALE